MYTFVGKCMCSIPSCFRKIFCCECRSKKLHPREAYSVSEARIDIVSENKIVVASLADIHRKKLQMHEDRSPPADHIDRVAHNRFVSTDVISIGTALRE